jgi:hypothetical protein
MHHMLESLEGRLLLSRSVSMVGVYQGMTEEDWGTMKYKSFCSITIDRIKDIPGPAVKVFGRFSDVNISLGFGGNMPLTGKMKGGKFTLQGDTMIVSGMVRDPDMALTIRGRVRSNIITGSVVAKYDDPYLPVSSQSATFSVRRI